MEAEPVAPGQTVADVGQWDSPQARQERADQYRAAGDEKAAEAAMLTDKSNAWPPKVITSRRRFGFRRRPGQARTVARTRRFGLER